MVLRSAKLVAAVVGVLAVLLAAVGCTDGDDSLDDLGDEAATTTTSDEQEPRADGSDDGDALTMAASDELAEVAEALVDAYREDGFAVAGAVEIVDPDDLADVVDSDDAPNVYLGGTPQVEAAVQAGTLGGTPTPLGEDVLVFVVKRGNPADLDADLTVFGASPVATGLCTTGTACGDAARDALDAASVTPEPDVEDDRHEFLINRVDDDTIDATLLWRSQVSRRIGKVQWLGLPETSRQTRPYAVGVVGESPAGGEFVGWLGSDAARQVLAVHGLIGLAQAPTGGGSGGTGGD